MPDKLNIPAIKKYIVLRKTAGLEEEEILASLAGLREAMDRKITTSIPVALGFLGFLNRNYLPNVMPDFA